jgi:hypothetical protein
MAYTFAMRFVSHDAVGAPSFASLEIVWNDEADCGRKGWVWVSRRS